MKKKANLSEAAKLRISPHAEERSEIMADLARRKSQKMTPEERKAHAQIMVAARKAKKSSS